MGSQIIIQFLLFEIGLSDNWLRHVQDVAAKHAPELSGFPHEEPRHRRLCELNVAEQVKNIGQCTAVQEAWERGQPLEVPGWIYDLKDGLIRALHVSHSGSAK